jgi:hypothetical protein
MKFEQAIEKLKNGARITRKGWKNNVHSMFSIKATSRGKFEIKNGIGQTDIQDSLPVKYEDCIADDWEIIIDPKDYKIFVSKQGELYINGDKISNQCSCTLTDWIDKDKPRKQALMERTAKIDISFIVDVDECAFGR